jgi:ankyrin repeat protein
LIEAFDMTRLHKKWLDMLTAVRTNDADRMLRLVRNGFIIESADLQGITALSHALYQQKYRVVAILLAYGADINTSDILGWTPLMWAAYNGRDEALRVALESGADPHKSNQKGETPLFWAVYKGHLTVVGMLLAVGADPTMYDTSGLNALAISTLTQQHQLTSLLHACASGQRQINGSAFKLH